MLKKTLFLLICCLLLAMPLCATEILYFSDPAFENFGPKTEPKTLFSHDLHAETYKVDCESCHHVFEDGKNVWKEGDPVQLCSDCHGGSKAELVQAYHMNCWGCHKRIREDYPEADTPTSKCARCHVPEEDLSSAKKEILKKTKQKNKKLMRVINQLKSNSFY